MKTHRFSRMPTRLCSDYSDGRGCVNPATYRGRCQRHAKQRNTETHRNRSIYNSARWKNTRRRVLFEQPLCECGEIATDVDHIMAIEDGGDPWQRTNLMGLCGPCHSSKTSREMRAR